MIEGAIFDMDGVLLDSMPVWEHTGERYLASMGIPAEPDLSRALFPLSLEAGARYLLDHYPLHGLDEGAVIRGITKTIEDFYLREAGLKPGTADFLREMHHHGIPMTVATSSDRKLAEAALERNGIRKYFSRIFTCSEVGAGKSKPDIYLEAAKWMKTRPDKTWVFEDALHAIETAAKAGFMLAGVYDDSSADAQPAIQAWCHVWLGREMDFTYFYSLAVKLYG